MKNFIKILMVSAITLPFSTSKLLAQTENPKEGPSSIRLSIGPETGIPVGALHNRYHWSVGGSAQLEIPITANKFSFIGSAGFNNFFSTSSGFNSNDLQLIPVKAGLRYYPVNNLYLQGQAGASFLINKEKGGYDKTAAFAYAPQIGYQFPVGRNFIDAGVRWEGNSKFKSDGAFNNFVGLRIAYNFGLK